MMFFFRFKAKPEAINPESRTSAGAYINCWISRKKKVEAEAVARKTIKKERWTILKLEKGCRIMPKTQRPSGMKYYKQALIDKEVLVFHTWPTKKTKKRSTEQINEGDGE